MVGGDVAVVVGTVVDVTVVDVTVVDVEVGLGGAARSSPAQAVAATQRTTTATRRLARLCGSSTVCDTTGMRRSPVAGLVIVALVAALASCSSEAARPQHRAEVALPAAAAVGVPSIESDPEATEEVVPVPSPQPQSPDPVAVLSSGGVVVPVLGRDPEGWKVSTPCGREALVMSATPLSLTGPVVLDPGHGGYDPGAVGPNGLPESELNLAVSRHAAAALERAGFPTVMTRNADHGMNLANRARLAVGLQARAFVSVHHNAAAWAPSAIPGSEMYHQVGSEESKRLAGLIYEEIVAALSAYSVPWVTSGAGVTWRTRSNGDDWYAMVRQPKGVAAALAELAFISNPAEADLLADPEVQKVEGEAVARGIVRFLTTSDLGSGYVEGGQMPPRPRTGGPRGGGGDDECDDPAL